MSALMIDGLHNKGQDVRAQNVMACSTLANIVKTSLGPMGLDKMLVDSMGDVTVTNDGATIMKQLQVEHPAAKILVDLSNLQDEEVGDGTTSVVILASELLRQGNELVKSGIHPTAVIAGFLLAKKEACKFVATSMVTKLSDLKKSAIKKAAATAISSKIIGLEADFFAEMAVDAVTAVKSSDSKGNPTYPVQNIAILKAHGQSARQSELVNGYALNCTRASQGMPSYIKNASIALLDIDLRKAKLGLGVQVVTSDPTKLDGIRQKEAQQTKDRINMILDAGANVILTTGGIDDTMMKLFVQRGAIGVRRVKKSDLKQLAKLTGGKLLISLADMEGGETFEPSFLGQADAVEETKVGDGELIYIRKCRNTRAQTVILRGANDFMLDEIDRSFHDCMMVVKRVLETKKVVPGGGCVEAALSVYLEHLADTMGAREQMAVAAFANSLLVIPKTLATNGTYDAAQLVSTLRAYHAEAQTAGGKADYKWTGLDLEKGKVRNNLKAGVLEPALSKVKMIKFATEAAVTILRIDDSIKMQPKQAPKDPHDYDH